MTGAGLAARSVALEAIGRVEDDHAYSTAVIPQLVDSLPDARDRAFASHLAYDTLRWRGTLDWILGQVLTRPMDAVEPPLQRILRMGTLQLWRMRIPDRAAVSTSVDLSRRAVPRGRSDGAAKFVNGVLRNVARGLDALPWPDPAEDLVGHLCLRTGHPAWIVSDLLDRYPPDDTEAILHADNDPPGLTLRAVGDRDALLVELRDAGLEAAPTPHATEGIRVPGADPRRLAAVQQGRAVPQDEASMLVVRTAAPQPGDTVIDLCAGPGGKTSHLATMVGEDGHIVAVELHPHRARRIREVTGRLGLLVDVVEGDATVVDLPRDVDGVLVDAPCTGLGVGRRRPEVRWRRRPEDAVALADLQVELIGRAVDLTRPDGHVTYAVCTWTAAETRDVTARVEARFGETLVREEARQLLPSTDGTDGMYVARWRVRA